MVKEDLYEQGWIQGGRRGPLPPPRSQDTKKYLRIYEDLDGGFVGDNQVLMLFHHLSSIFTHK